jgi:hypothetical protein
VKWRGLVGLNGDAGWAGCIARKGGYGPVSKFDYFAK